jgi:hypothetical protein
MHLNLAKKSAMQAAPNSAQLALPFASTLDASNLERSTVVLKLSAPESGAQCLEQHLEQHLEQQMASSVLNLAIDSGISLSLTRSSARPKFARMLPVKSKELDSNNRYLFNFTNSKIFLALNRQAKGWF